MNPPPLPPSEQQEDENQRQQHNPYAAPSMSSMEYQSAGVSNEGHFGLLTEPRKCEAGRGLTWLTSAFNIFKENWLLWLVMSLVFMLIVIGLSVIPFVSLLVNLVIFHFLGSFMLIAAKQEEGRVPNFSDMFVAFQTHFVPLLVLALIYFVLTIVVFIPMIGILLASFGFSAFSGAEPNVMASGSLLLIAIGTLVTLALIVPVVMSVYLAPALIVLHDIEPVEAMKMSFKGCLKNIVPFLVIGLVLMVVLPLLTVLTIGLGMIVAAPILMISYYTAYRDIWSNKMMGEF